MSVYIKDIDMPVIELEWTIRRGADGKWYVIDTNAETTDGKWHEIVPIPPHGRLGDLDALYTELAKRKSYGELSAKSALRAVANAPTIIPASKESE